MLVAHSVEEDDAQVLSGVCRTGKNASEVFSYRLRPEPSPSDGWDATFPLRRELVEHAEQDSERAGPGLRELAMYGVSHPAPNECGEMVRTDGTRRDVVPGDPGLDARRTVGHVATDEPIAVAFATGGRGGHRGAQVYARALLLESRDQLTPELRHNVLPRQSKHAEHLGEIDVAYAARKQALALDEQVHA